MDTFVLAMFVVETYFPAERVLTVVTSAWVDPNAGHVLWDATLYLSSVECALSVGLDCSNEP